MSKYTAAQAKAKAKQIHDRFGAGIADACAGTSVPEDFLGGFVGVEAGIDHAGHIKETATRFEPGVFHHLQLVRDGLAHSWSHITTADLKDATDGALKNLATSYGLTQIMGWHMIHDLDGAIEDLRNPEKHLGYAVQLLEIVAGTYLRKKNFDAVLHIWNSGSPTGRTYDPDYVHNALAVKAAYAELVTSDPVSAAAPAQDVAAATDASSEQTTSLPEQPPAITQEAVPVQTVAAEPQNVDAQLSKWSARFTMIPSAILTAGAGIWTWATSAPAHLVETIFIIFGSIVTLYIGLEKLFKYLTAKHEREIQESREARAQQIQMALINSAASKSLNNVALVPPPATVPNSDAEGLAN